MRNEEFSTTNIELAAALMTATNKRPLAIRAGVEFGEIVFPASEAIQAVITRYATGTLMQEVRRLAGNRSWLNLQLRQLDREGKEMRYGQLP